MIAQILQVKDFGKTQVGCDFGSIGIATPRIQTLEGWQVQDPWTFITIGFFQNGYPKRTRSMLSDLSCPSFRGAIPSLPPYSIAVVSTRGNFAPAECFLIDLRERERSIDLLVLLFIQSLVDSRMCPDQGSNPQP